MTQRYDTMIVGQGLAGTTLAWKLIEAGQRVLVVDGESGRSSSSVAAGLMTPVTGKRMVCSPTFEHEWRAANRYYQEIEQRFGVELLSLAPMIRVFDRESDREAFLNRSDRPTGVSVERWEGQLEHGGAAKLGVKISPAGRLNVERYLKNSRAEFQRRDGYRRQQLRFDGDVRMGDGDYELVESGITAASMVLCQGAELNERFPKVPDNPAKGEIWKVRLNNTQIKQVVHRSIWVAPDEETSKEGSMASRTSGRQFTVGATYEWRDFDLTPSEKGAAELRRKLSYLLSEEAEVDQTLVGIRPTMKDRQPVLGQHQDFQGLWVFNGLGSKGTLKAPLLADSMVLAMTAGQEIAEEQSYQRLLPSEFNSLVPLTKLAQEKISEVVEPGDVVVDATVGRGFDTAFLSRKVGQTGRVIGFDVQREALEATTGRLSAIGTDNVELHHQGHETAGAVLGDRVVKAAMFNLGFLPRSDKTVVTKVSTTIQAISAIYDRLKDGGRMTLLCYRGHEGGPEEYEAVRAWLEDHEVKRERFESPVVRLTSPILFVVTKVEA